MLQGADKLEHVATEHFWMSGMYWGLTAMAIMGKLDQIDSAKVLEWVSSRLRDLWNSQCAGQLGSPSPVGKQ